MVAHPVPLDQRVMATIALLERRMATVENIVNDPVAIGSTLARSSITSTNYVTGSTGWSLNTDGSGEITSDVVLDVGGTEVVIGPTTPVGLPGGSFWFDTSSGSPVMKVYNAGTSTWVVYQYGTSSIANNAITQALLSNNAVGTAQIIAASVGTAQLANAAVTAAQVAANTLLAYNTAFTAAGIAGVNVFIDPPTPYDWTFSPSSGTTGSFVTSSSNISGPTPMSVGDTFTNSAGRGGPFTVTAISAPSGGNVTVNFAPTATTAFNSGDTLYGGTQADLWFNSSSGYQLSVWNNGAWSLSQLGGAALANGTITATQIAAATITGSLIAASTITGTLIAGGTVAASNLVSGIVVAGIVNSTTITTATLTSSTITSTTITGGTITGSSIVADGTSGEFLIYSSTPASGNLIGSFSPVSGTDGFSNGYNKGFWVYDTTGNQIGLVPGGGTSSMLALAAGSSTPTPPSGCAAIYGTTAGGVSVVDEGDGNAYATQRRSQVTTGAGTSIGTSVTAVYSNAVSTRTYRIHALLFVTANNTQTWGWDFQGPGDMGGTLSVVAQSGVTQIAAVSMGVNDSSFRTGSINSGTTVVVTIDGVIIVNTGGTFSLSMVVSTGSAGVHANSSIDIMPV